MSLKSSGGPESDVGVDYDFFVPVDKHMMLANSPAATDRELEYDKYTMLFDNSSCNYVVSNGDCVGSGISIVLRTNNSDG